jgi:hypothetical protein
MCDAEPAPAEPNFTVERFALTYAMNSGNESAGKVLGAISVRGASTTRLTGVKSLFVLYGGLL